ncbi:MAG: DUF4367 domain-containing protein [Evtepia sp.]|nr:DUF4367 domain-containing protein [Evtepia sp.]
MISEERLRTAARAVSQAMIDSLPEPEDCHHDFSPEFERKMKKLLRRSRHWGLYQGLKRAACFFLVLLLSGGIFLTVNAEAREIVFGWVSEKFEDAQRYFYPGKTTSSVDIVRYRLDVPDGYWLEDTLDVETLVNEIYLNEEGEYISFTYQYETETSAGEEYVIDTDTEKKQVRVNGVTADLYLSNSEDANNTIIWTDPETGALIDVTAFMAKDDLIDLAESVVREEK